MSGQERAPRGLYFKAEDRPELKAKPKNPKVPDQYGVECNQRMRKLAKVLEDARAVVKAADTLQSLDDAGMIMAGIELTEARIEFLVDSFQILSDDVETAEARWRRDSRALAEDNAPGKHEPAGIVHPGEFHFAGELNHESINRVIEDRRKQISPKLWGQAL